MLHMKNHGHIHMLSVELEGDEILISNQCKVNEVTSINDPAATLNITLMTHTGSLLKFPFLKSEIDFSHKKGIIK